MINHAYSHLIGTTVGIALGAGIVAATVMTPEVGQDQNYLLVMTYDQQWHTVHFMETYRKDFVNSTL